MYIVSQAVQFVQIDLLKSSFLYSISKCAKVKNLKFMYTFIDL